MKRTIFLAIVWIGICFFGSGQTYLSENNKWTEYVINIQSNYITAKNQYWTAGDTIINGQTYKKIVTHPRPWPEIGDNGYIGAIREDNGKVYAILRWGESEFLLYDYTIQVGDVIRSTSPEGYLSCPLTVTQINEITLETGKKRKRFFLDEGITWIEGIGSTGGLFHDAMWHATNYTVSYLVCFQNDNIPIYIDDVHCLDRKCCEIIPGGETDIPQISTNKEVVVFPNPTSGTFFLSLPSSNCKHILIRILDNLGCEIYKQLHATSESIEVNISGYSSGSYYVIALDNESSLISYKIIKN